MKNLFLMLLLVLFSQPIFAQFEKIIHQSFEIEEVIDLKFDLHDEYEVVSWAGNTVLTETKVQLHDASPSIFKYYLEKERYNMQGELKSEGLFEFVSNDMERKPIRTKTGECYEFVSVRIFLPEEFVKISENHWQFDNSTDAVSNLKEEEKGNE